MTSVVQQAGPFVGAPIPRKEDRALLTGRGRFIDNLSLPGTVHMHVVRSPYAHARIRDIDTSAAASAEGVVAVLTGADLADDWKGGSLPCAWPVTEDITMPPHLPLAVDKARYQGDGIAVVVATSRALAKDAAELVEVDWEPLPATVDPAAALEEGAPLVHEDLGTNRSYTWSLEAGEVEQAFANAAHKVSCRYYHPRLIPNAMEPRGVLAAAGPAGDLTLYSATQIPHILRVTLAMTLGLTESQLRIVAPDVGGGFGSKLDVYAEEALALALTRRLGVPVKWVEERSEGYLATIHGRDLYQEVELAADRDGRFTAVRARLTAAMGAYLQLVTPGVPLLGAWLYAGVYDIPAYSFTCTGVFTNTTPTDAYRGAGRPEATYAIERTVDALAREMGMEPAELRRRNVIREFPKTISSGLTIDSGDYTANLERALALAGYHDLRAEQAARRERGDTKLLGIGLSTYNEMCGLAPSKILGAIRYGAGGWESATVRVLPTGSIQVLTGTSPHGQGHETAWAQIVADQLGYDISEIEVLHGDTAVAPLGMDSYGSRSLAVGGIALHMAGEKIIEKARAIAAHQLEAAEADLEYERGRFTVKGTDKGMTVKEVALQAWTAHNLPDGVEPGLEATATYDPPNFSWPAGAHVAVVEVDAETCDTRLVRYVAVDDVGTVVNPTIVDGQVHGGVAQGVAAALYEEGRYDEDGNLQTPNLVSYLVPSAADLPSFELARTETPSPTNPLGVKGVGETGTIASPAAVMNAVVDALAHLGVKDLQMPATPERVWRAIEEARR
jgi:carbon-monoxide dehydrogenase large subunit